MIDWMWSKLTQTTSTTAYLKSQEMIKILKQSVKVYVADTVLRYYMMFTYDDQYSP